MTYNLNIPTRPIAGSWPGPMTRPSLRKRSSFSASWSKTDHLLRRELGFLGARRTVMHIDVYDKDIRQDGQLRANARPKSPAVMIAFEHRKHGWLQYPCDRFTTWQDNVRAIALSLEALRKVDRYGVTREAQQYAGFRALPKAATPTTSYEAACTVLGREANMVVPVDGQLNEAVFYRVRLGAMRNAHPDTVMREMDAASVDAIVTDPPYALTANKKGGTGPASLNVASPAGRARVTTGFMGKAWDGKIPGVEAWAEVLRVAKPGAHLLAFGGTRTFHRLTCAIEDAGWEIRDCIMWVYGSGFPKSLDISKAIDRAAGAERANKTRITAKQWDGWGTALKPAWEPIIVAMKPRDGTFAENAQRHGVAGLNIDGCRVGPGHQNGQGRDGEASSERRYADSGAVVDIAATPGPRGGDPAGRWPANLIHDGSEEVVELFPQQTGGGTPPRRLADNTRNTFGEFKGNECPSGIGGSSGSAARFFYAAKASRAERDAGLEGLDPAVLARSNQAIAEAERGSTIEAAAGAFNLARIVRNNHPTVKPVSLLKYLCKLVSTPTGGTILDPFCGSGSTGIGATSNGQDFIGIEDVAEYCEIARKRIAAAISQSVLELGA